MIYGQSTWAWIETSSFGRLLIYVRLDTMGCIGYWVCLAAARSSCAFIKQPSNIL